MVDEIRLIEERIKEEDMESNSFSLLELNCNVNYNNEVLYQLLLSFIGSHQDDYQGDNINLYFNMLVDDSLYETFLQVANTGKRGQIVHLSYCSKEKGTLRAVKFVHDEYCLYLAQKTPAILIERNDHFYYVINNEYLQRINFKFDGFKFFEHVLNKMKNS